MRQEDVSEFVATLNYLESPCLKIEMGVERHINRKTDGGRKDEQREGGREDGEKERNVKCIYCTNDFECI